MKPSRSLVVVVLLGLLVSACGGGGSGDGSQGGGTHPPTGFTVITSMTGDGSGTISPTSRSVTQGSATSFAISAGSGSSIAGVSGCNGSLSGSTYTTGPINGNCTVSATFNRIPPPTFTVTVTADVGGSVSPASRIVAQGTAVTLSAIPEAGYRFLHWLESEQSVVVSTDQEYTFAVESNVDLKAYFEAQQLKLEPATLLIENWSDTYKLDLVVAGQAGAPVTIELVSEPKHGIVEIDATALRIRYRPVGVGFNEDLFELRVASGTKLSEPQEYQVRYRDTNENGLPDFIDPQFSGTISVSGIIEQDRRLSAGQYVIDGDLQVRSGVTLQLDSGAVVYLMDGVEIVVAGALVIDASSQSMARLLPATINPVGWRGIRFIDGHMGSEISGSTYVSGTLFRGVEVAGVEERAGARAIDFCSGTPRKYLFEEVLIHGSIGDEGINYLGKCISIGTVPEILFHRSVAYVDDRSFVAGFPTRIFNTARVNMQDSVVFGYSIYGLGDLMDVLQIHRSTIDLVHATDWAIPMLQLTYRSAGWESTVTNSKIRGDIEINRGFDQSLFPVGPEVSNNILRQKGTEYLLIARGSTTPVDTIQLAPNYYLFETTEAEGVLDGKRNVSLPFIDISNQLNTPPEAGPNEHVLPVLNTLIQMIRMPPEQT